MQLRPVRAELLREDRRTDGRTDGRTDVQTDRQTDMTKLIVVFRNFAKTPKKETPIHKIIQNTQMCCAGKTRNF